MESINSKVIYWEEIPVDCYAEICSNVTESALACMTQTCTAWNKKSLHDSVWKKIKFRFNLNKMPGHIKCLPRTSLKERCRMFVTWINRWANINAKLWESASDIEAERSRLMNTTVSHQELFDLSSKICQAASERTESHLRIPPNFYLRCVLHSIWKREDKTKLNHVTIELALALNKHACYQEFYLGFNPGFTLSPGMQASHATTGLSVLKDVVASFYNHRISEPCDFDNFKNWFKRSDLEKWFDDVRNVKFFHSLQAEKAFYLLPKYWANGMLWKEKFDLVIIYVCTNNSNLKSLYEWISCYCADAYNKNKAQLAFINEISAILKAIPDGRLLLIVPDYAELCADQDSPHSKIINAFCSEVPCHMLLTQNPS